MKHIVYRVNAAQPHKVRAQHVHTVRLKGEIHTVKCVYSKLCMDLAVHSLTRCVCVCVCVCAVYFVLNIKL